MITSFSIKNFKSYRDAEIHLAPLTLFIGANASGKSNALEAIRLLSWLARGSRLDDIEGGGIKGTDLLLRGQTLDLFRDVKKGFELGCRIEDIEGNRNRLSLEIGLIADHLAISNESVSNDSELLPLYRVDSKPGAHTDEI
ncbi:MAG: AAA family ATPase, partial [Methanosarcinaceae archaeon]|nr:AAA family ATPase [Methanosarcinaceae archaeon]